MPLLNALPADLVAAMKHRNCRMASGFGDLMYSAECDRFSRCKSVHGEMVAEVPSTLEGENVVLPAQTSNLRALHTKKALAIEKDVARKIQNQYQFC